jgi:two-component system nitrogen regulation response regulator NtrX
MTEKSRSLTGSRILVIDDHRNIRLSLQVILEGEGASVTVSENLSNARAVLGLHNASDPSTSLPYDILLLDIRLPDGNGLDLLKQLKDGNHANHVIVISGEGTTQEAFKATQIGAFDFIEKPFTPERILVSVKRCLEFNRIEKANANLVKDTTETELLGEHPKLKDILSLVAKVGPTSGRVLITGESGTGKELIARAIHRASPRAHRPMIKINCAAIPKNLMESELFGHEKGAFTGAVKQRHGVFERADGGTLFLDEIGELELDLQAKLLRVLQNGEFMRIGSDKTITSDVRVICATNRDLKAMAQSGDFREDLFYRLNVVSIHSPALRERATDIPLLSKKFLAECSDEHSLGPKEFSPKAIEQLKSYNWPGNIRELRNVIERTAILSSDPVIDTIETLENPQNAPSVKTVTVATISESENPSITLELGLQSWESFHELVDREYLRFVLKQAKNNVSEAARLLDLERAYMHRLMKKLGIQRDTSDV